MVEVYLPYTLGHKLDNIPTSTYIYLCKKYQLVALILALPTKSDTKGKVSNPRCVCFNGSGHVYGFRWVQNKNFKLTNNWLREVWFLLISWLLDW